jgi:D-alanyl-D-alanine dipeptidase
VCKCAGVLQLAAKIEAAEEAEHVPQWDTLFSQLASERGIGVRSPERQRARAMRRCGGDHERSRPAERSHAAALRNFGARDTFLAVRTLLVLALAAASVVTTSCVQPPPYDTPPPAGTPAPARTPPPARTPAPAVSTPARTVNAPATDVASDSAARAHLIDIRLIEPTIMVDPKYATPDNFTGAPLPGYEAKRALLRREAGFALARVQKRARFEGFALKVFDAYRPVRATLAMVDWTERTGQRHLLRDGYIASRSWHNLGLAVDLTLIGGDGQELDMGTPFDTFSSAAHTANASGEVAANRRLLVRLMEAEGFTKYEKEWWHFSYSVPNPLRFDLVIR